MHKNLHKCAVLCRFCTPRGGSVQVLGCLLFQFRIAQTGVVGCLQLFYQYCLGVGDVSEGDGAFLEVAFCHLGINKFVLGPG